MGVEENTLGLAPLICVPTQHPGKARLGGQRSGERNESPNLDTDNILSIGLSLSQCQGLIFVLYIWRFPRPGESNFLLGSTSGPVRLAYSIIPETCPRYLNPCETKVLPIRHLFSSIPYIGEYTQ